MTSNARRSFPLVLGLLTVASLASSSRAQSDGFNPYGNQGLPDYREFTTPIYGNNPSLPGQARLNGERIGGGTRANQFESYSRSQQDDETDPAKGPAGASRAPRAGRASGTVEGRKYDEALKKRNEAYARARAETDPVKRARLLRQLDQDAMKHPLASDTERPAATPIPRASAKGARASAPAPSPFETARGARNSAPPPPVGSASKPNRAPAPNPARNSTPPATGTAPAPATAPAAGGATPAPAPPATSTAPPATAPAAPGAQAPAPPVESAPAASTIPPPR